MDDPIRILQVGAGAGVVDALEAAQRFVVETAAGPGEALDRIDTGAIDCVVSGYQLSDGDGIDLLVAVRESHPDMPFILFTGTGDEAVASVIRHTEGGLSEETARKLLDIDEAA